MPFPYFGAKFRLAGKYPEPTHNTIIEPFAGSAAYSLHGDRWKKQVILIELDPQIIQLWRWLQTTTPHTIMSLPDMHKGMNLSVFGEMESPPRTLANLVAQSSVTNRNYVSEWMAMYWEPRRKRVADRLHKIGHWDILEGDYTIAPDIQATWFIDPPYQMASVGYQKAPSSNINFQDLGHWVMEREGQIMVCEQEGANWLPFRHLYTAMTQAGHMKKEMIYP